MLVSRDIGISGGCVGPHDVTPDLPAPARLSPHRRVLGNARACVEVPHHEEGEGEDGRGRLIPSYYNGTACQAACCFSIKETDADVGESASVAARVAVAAACISIEGRSGGSHDVTPDPLCLLDGVAAVADPDEVAHGAT